MALHGTIEVNGEAIGGWQARRIQPLVGEDDTYDYEVRVVVNGDLWAGVVQHRYSAGAASLAAKCLLAATMNGVAS